MTIPELIREACRLDSTLEVIVRDTTSWNSNGLGPPVSERKVRVQSWQRGNPARSNEDSLLVMDGDRVTNIHFGPTLLWSQCRALAFAFDAGQNVSRG